MSAGGMSAVSSRRQSASSRREGKSILTPAPAAGAARRSREAVAELLSWMCPQRCPSSSNIAALGAFSRCSPALLPMHTIEEVQAPREIPAAKARAGDAFQEESSAFPVTAEFFCKSLREAAPKSKGRKAKWVWQP